MAVACNLKCKVCYLWVVRGGYNYNSQLYMSELYVCVTVCLKMNRTAPTNVIFPSPPLPFPFLPFMLFYLSKVGFNVSVDSKSLLLFRFHYLELL